MKKIFVILVLGIFLLNISFTFANESHQQAFEEGRQLVENKINCNELNNKQLESIGEYYMEQMHSGEQHEAMHEMMGIEEGTEGHEQFHVNIARMMYCGDGNMMGPGMKDGGMMGMMPVMMNMMGGGNMMNSGGMMQGMMGGYYGGYNVFGWVFMILIIILLILLIVWLIKQIQTPRDNRKKRR